MAETRYDDMCNHAVPDDEICRLCPAPGEISALLEFNDPQLRTTRANVTRQQNELVRLRRILLNDEDKNERQG